MTGSSMRVAVTPAGLSCYPELLPRAVTRRDGGRVGNRRELRLGVHGRGCGAGLFPVRKLFVEQNFYILGHALVLLLQGCRVIGVAAVLMIERNELRPEPLPVHAGLGFPCLRSGRGHGAPVRYRAT